MKNILSLLLPFAILISGCNQEELRNSQLDFQDGRIFTASFEQNETRTYIENGNLLRWNAGDQISLFDGNTLNRQYKFDGENGDNSGTFSIVSNPFGTGNDLDCHYAVYPYASDVKITENGVIAATLPAEQSYAENSFGLGANTMVAVTQNADDTFLKFRNVGGYLKLQLYGDNVTVKSITLTGNNNEKIAGKATITPAYGQSPTLAMSDDAKTSITLDCGEGVKIGTTEETATAFWIVVPPTTFEEGLTITVTEIDGESFNKSTSNAVVVERNIIKPMATFEVEIEKIPNNQIWYTSSGGKISPDSDALGVTITSNICQDGKGIITFDGDLKIIGSEAFIAHDWLLSIILPNSVTKIGREAFASCTSLTSITMSKNIVTIEENAFEECSSLITVTIPNSMTNIENEVFMGCTSLTSLTIPNSVTSIGGRAFEDCTSLTSLTIPNSVATIADNAFNGCNSLSSIVVEEGNSIYDSRDNCNAIIETSSNTLISGCKSTIIPNSVTTIGTVAFAGCTSLTSITIPNSVTNIKGVAFSGCSSLTSIIIPSNVTEIGFRAFKNCTSLTLVEIKATTPPTINSETFSNCGDDIKFYVPAESINAYKAADYWKDLNIVSEIIAVDLGLSVKWANYNIGATKLEDYGAKFAWGETTTKASYVSDNSITHNKTQKELTSSRIIDSEGNLLPNYDAAVVNWGNDWRMPTKAEVIELRNNCTWQRTTYNNVTGFLVTGSNGNSIFLPLGGYWTTYVDELASYSYRLYLYSSSSQAVCDNRGYRYHGYAIRPVQE